MEGEAEDALNVDPIRIQAGQLSDEAKAVLQHAIDQLRGLGHDVETLFEGEPTVRDGWQFGPEEESPR